MDKTFADLEHVLRLAIPGRRHAAVTGLLAGGLLAGLAGGLVAVLVVAAATAKALPF